MIHAPAEAGKNIRNAVGEGDIKDIRRLQTPDSSKTWTKQGALKAVRCLLSEPNTLFDSLLNKLEDYPELSHMLEELLFKGKEIPYVIGIRSIEMALMFGFVKRSHNVIMVANRIFETLLYNLFLHDIYGDRGQKFFEEEGRRYFLLYIKPIINGISNYYIESETRNRERTDLIIDYRGEQFIIETKVWYGNAYHVRGEQQLSDYLDYYHLKRGYMLSFNFNKRKKEIGVKEILLEDKVLVEAVV